MANLTTPQETDAATRQVGEIYEAFAYFIKVMQARGDLLPGHEDGVTGAQTRTLQALADGPHSMGTLSTRLYVHPSTASGMIDRLVAKGLVERQRSAADRRRVDVGLTEAGWRYVEHAAPSVVQCALDRLRRVPPEELGSLHGALQRLRAIFAAAVDDVVTQNGEGERGP